MSNVTSGSAVVMTFEETIAYHLEYNRSIPLSSTWAERLAPACVQAINAVNSQDIDKLIALPAGASCVWKDGTRSNLCPAYALVYIYELQKWLNKSWQ